MKPRLFSFLILLFPAMSWGGAAQPPPAQVMTGPTLDEGGLVMLALALVGTGFALLRRNKH